MTEKMEQYLEMVQQLKAFGDALVDEYYALDCDDEAGDEFISEVECMSMHLECCERILGQAL